MTTKARVTELIMSGGACLMNLCFWESMVASLKREAIDGMPPPGVEPAAQHGRTHQV